jgi:hypothetical protein
MSSSSNLMDQEALHSLIAETEALGWDEPARLVAHDDTPSQRGFAFIGKILSLKSHNIHNVRSTLVSSWSFIAPFSMEVLSQNKFLFIVPQETHYKSIIQQGPWNIRGSLLVIQPWSLVLAIDEVKLHLCGFWIQVHGLPLQYMTTLNAIKIGKGIGNILELDNNNSPGLIYRKYIRFKIEIDTSLPLASGFDMLCEGEEETRWISFLYERLDEYCYYCGLIGHNIDNCPSPKPSTTPTKYKRSLKAPPNILPRLFSKIQIDDSDSGVLSVASVGNSPSSLVPSQMLDSHGSS